MVIGKTERETRRRSQQGWGAVRGRVVIPHNLPIKGGGGHDPESAGKKGRLWRPIKGVIS